LDPSLIANDAPLIQRLGCYAGITFNDIFDPSSSPGSKVQGMIIRDPIFTLDKPIVTLKGQSGTRTEGVATSTVGFHLSFPFMLSYDIAKTEKTNNDNKDPIRTEIKQRLSASLFPLEILRFRQQISYRSEYNSQDTVFQVSVARFRRIQEDQNKDSLYFAVPQRQDSIRWRYFVGMTALDFNADYLGANIFLRTVPIGATWSRQTDGMTTFSSIYFTLTHPQSGIRVGVDYKHMYDPQEDIMNVFIAKSSPLSEYVDIAKKILGVK
jgi:hypothetical protein